MATLSALFGQETAIEALRRALESECLPGTYLFTGPTGVGKGAVARAFAQAAACLNPRHAPFDACGECDSCRRAEAGTHPEIVTIFPAGEQIQIWQFWTRENKATRGILSDTLSYAPLIGRRRLYLIEQADKLNESAANSLLKALEEPPPYVQFVLMAPHPARVLPTILSRSQVVRFQAVGVPELAAFLQERLKLEPARAGMLAAYSEGRIGQAMQMAQSAAVGDEINRILDFAESLPQAPRVRALRLAEQMRKLAAQTKALVGEAVEPSDTASAGEDGESASAPTAKERTGRRQQAAVFDLLVAFYRDLLALRIGGAGAQNIVNRERAAALARLSKAGEPERWMRCLDALMLARRRLDANANVSLVTEILAMDLLRV